MSNEKTKLNRKHYVITPFLLPAVVIISLAIGEHFWGWSFSTTSVILVLVSIFVAVFLMIRGEIAFEKKLIAILDDQNNAEEYRHVLDHNYHPREFSTNRPSTKRILEAYLLLHQKDYSGAKRLASQEVMPGCSSFIKQLRKDILAAVNQREKMNEDFLNG